jgi:hypothetical protein
LSSSFSSSSFIIFSDVGDDSGEITDGDGSKDRTRKQPREEEDKEEEEEEREAAFSRFFFREDKGESLLKEAQEEDIFISFCI